MSYVQRKMNKDNLIIDNNKNEKYGKGNIKKFGRYGML